MIDSHPWLPFGIGPDDAAARLFCLPFAGGGASNFLGWRNLFPGVGVAPIQYPGHETRIGEPLLNHVDDMVRGLADVVAPLLDRPYLLFGYSMGAKLAFALARRLVQTGFDAPTCLLVAAHVPPDRISLAAQSHHLPDPEFKQVLREYGGMPEELLDDEDFWAMLLPVLRADFALASQDIGPGMVDCPILAYAGERDATASISAMAGWHRFTHAECRLHAFAGGHFFLRDATDFESVLTTDVAAAVRLAEMASE